MTGEPIYKREIYFYAIPVPFRRLGHGPADAVQSIELTDRVHHHPHKPAGKNPRPR